MAIGTAAAIGIGLAGVGKALDAKSQNKAAGKAADVSLAVADKNNALAREFYGKNEGYLAPIANAGSAPGRIIGNALGYNNDASFGDGLAAYLGGSDYGFKLHEGNNALASGYAGNGAFQSGAAMKALEGYRQNLQAGYRGEYMNALQGQQGIGLSGASALAGVSNNFVNTTSANNNSAGSAAANALLMKGANNPLAGSLGLIGGGIFGMGR